MPPEAMWGWDSEPSHLLEELQAEFDDAWLTMGEMNCYATLRPFQAGYQRPKLEAKQEPLTVYDYLLEE